MIPNVCISSDLIVGCPGETEADFNETMEVVKKLKYDLAYTFIYSPREGTPASRMEDLTPMEVKKNRLAELNALINHYALENNKKYLGKEVMVLLEGHSDKENKLMGYTDTMKLVNVKASDEHIGQIVPVKITDVKTWSLEGELVNDR